MLLKFVEYPPHLHFTIPALGVTCALSILVGAWLLRRGQNAQSIRMAAVLVFALAVVSGLLWLVSLWNPEIIWWNCADSQSISPRLTCACSGRGPLRCFVPSALPFRFAGHAAEARFRWTARTWSPKRQKTSSTKTLVPSRRLKQRSTKWFSAREIKETFLFEERWSFIWHSDTFRSSCSSEWKRLLREKQTTLFLNFRGSSFAAKVESAVNLHCVGRGGNSGSGPLRRAVHLHAAPDANRSAGMPRAILFRRGWRRWALNR